MNRWLRLIYPAEFFHRYADEVTELLKASRQPVRDHLNVVVHAGRIRSEQLMSDLPRHLANFVLAAAIFLLGFALNDLAGGVGEILRHWWSSAAVLLVVIAAAARLAVGVIERRRTDQPATPQP